MRGALDTAGTLTGAAFAAKVAALADRGRVSEYKVKRRKKEYVYFRIRIPLDGVNRDIYRHKGVRFSDRAHAQRVLEQMRGRLEGVEPPFETAAAAEFLPDLSKPNRIETLLREYLEDLEERARLGEVSDYTVANLRTRVPTDPPRKAQYFAFWSMYALSEVRRAQVEKFKRHLELEGLAPSSVALLMDQFKAFLTWCKEVRELPFNPPAFPAVPVQRKRPPLLTPAQQRAGIEAIPWRERGIFLAMALGVRPGAARPIRMADVHDGYIDIHSAVQGAKATAKVAPNTKGRKAYWLPLTRDLARWIAEHSDGRLPSAWLFPDPNTGGIWAHGSLERIWRSASESAGIPHVPLYKAMKHSFLTGRLLAGKSKEALAEFASITPAQLETYAQWARELSAQVLDDGELAEETRATVVALRGDKG